MKAMSFEWIDRLARTTKRLLARFSEGLLPEEERTVFVPGSFLEEGGELQVTVVNDWTPREDGRLMNRSRQRILAVKVPPRPEAEKPQRLRLPNVGDWALNLNLVRPTRHRNERSGFPVVRGSRTSALTYLSPRGGDSASTATRR